MDNMVGQRIKERRKELHITQTQVQEKTSVTSGNLSCIENGKYLPSAIALLELSRVLDCSIDWILTGESKISNNSDILDYQEKNLLKYFRNMSVEDQDELLVIAKIKADKKNNSKDAQSPLSQNSDLASETA